MIEFCFEQILNKIMSKLQLQYSKELARELGKIAVYLPGEQVNIGDIVTFPYGKTFLGKSRPLGSFKKISSLEALGISFPEPQFSNTPDTYQFSSKNDVSIDFNLDNHADLGNEKLPNGKAKLNIKFTSEGAIYFLGIDCNKKELKDISALENEINAKGKKLLWKNTYLVTSITVAKKAFIAQSRSKSSEFTVNGDIKGIQTKTFDISTQTNLTIQKQKGDLFIKDWSDDVTVFMDLIKFEKEVFEQNNKGFKNTSNSHSDNSRIILKPVQIETLLTD